MKLKASKSQTRTEQLLSLFEWAGHGALHNDTCAAHTPGGLGHVHSDTS
jgi:hypothetical protein